ncbi:MAG: aspartate kinase [Clostridiales bacterium]|nr:aspartate kinase [Clostridiales bacterium]
MNTRVCKFGGSSLADAGGFRRARDILLSDPRRRFVVPSAPGKRFSADEKVTDLLYRCYAEVEKGEGCERTFERVAERYLEIASDLGVAFDMRALLDETKEAIGRIRTPDFAASRGEYLNGVLLSKYLGWDFIDAAGCVRFDKRGQFAPELTNRVLAEELKRHENAVIPGFYGAFPDGSVRTFSRGGSDISGAVVARAAAAELYENWTDVSGFLMADPRIVENPKGIEKLTYKELRELSYMGATVLHEDAIFPVHREGIPTNIRNTNEPDHPGTMIVNGPEEIRYKYPITGIAGHRNFSLISIEKAMMNAELGFGRRVLQAVEEFGISFEHLPTGIDTMCVIISDKQLNACRDRLINRLSEICQPDHIEISSGLALIATVGQGMVRTRGTAAKLFTALYRAKVNVRMIDQGSSELNIIIGVDNVDFEVAVRAIYDIFVKTRF